MKSSFLTKICALIAAIFCCTSMSAADWTGSYSVKAQYEDALNGNKVVDQTFIMKIAKDGSDVLVTSFCGYDDILYGGLLTSTSGTTKLNILCDNIVMTSTDAEREQGIMNYVALRDKDGGKNNIVMTKKTDGTFTMDAFTLVKYQRGQSNETVTRRYTILSITAGEGGGEEEVDTDWELMYPLQQCFTFHIDSKTGNFMASDFRDDLKGGIYVSQDKGATWTKTKVNDNNYNKFYETDEYIFALGYGGRIARSDDGGLTWELLNYRRAVIDVVGEENIEYDAAYDMLQVGNRIYVVDYAGGVIYTEDYGETWSKTNDDIFLEVEEGKDGKTETFHNVLYGITQQNGHILVMGLYYVYEYDAKKDSWKIVRNDSNLMAIHCHHKGWLYCGRSMPNDGVDVKFLEVTEDGEEWIPTGRPDTEDNNVRALGSNQVVLVAGLQSTGLYYSTDDGYSWEAMDIDGLPLRYPGQASLTSQKLTPLSIEFDDQYVYVAFFGDNPQTESGVWRYPISKLDLAAIQQITTTTTSSTIYDLSGRRVSTPSRGLFIVDGKKVIF